MSKHRQTRCITLDIRPGNENQALSLVSDFLSTYQDHHRIYRPERRGVGYKMQDGSTFFVYGDAGHIRVREVAPFGLFLRLKSMHSGKDP